MVREMGGDLDHHRSQTLTLDMLAQTDCLFTMTCGHLRLLEALFERTGPAPSLLCPSDRDVADPIGADIEVYKLCARQILECLEARLPQLLEY